MSAFNLFVNSDLPDSVIPLIMHFYCGSRLVLLVGLFCWIYHLTLMTLSWEHGLALTELLIDLNPIETLCVYNRMCELGVSSLLLVITHQIGFDEISDIAIHDSLYIGGLVSRTMVFYAAVVKDVTADL